MKKLPLLVLGLCVVASEAWAISRYDPTGMACAQVQETIAREGAVILRYRSPRTPGLTLFDRYVDSDRFCTRGQFAFPATVPSADTRACPVHRCKIVDLSDRRQRIIVP